tara:strand:- start:429 stop:602 length:174 start_codon:yes stop_codon:yes gene_type:complete
MRLFDFNDVKVALASVSGLGNWALEIDMILKVLISLASLVYIVLKIRELLKNKTKKS